MIRTMTRSRKATRVLIATLAVAVLPLVLPAAPPVHAAGLRNCADLTGSAAGRVGCYEMVWADGVQVRMTFSNLDFPSTTGAPMGNFYVLAPQTDTLQGWVPFPMTTLSVTGHLITMATMTSTGMDTSCFAALTASPAEPACLR